jgi:hypothetical protein
MTRQTKVESVQRVLENEKTRPKCKWCVFYRRGFCTNPKSGHYYHRLHKEHPNCAYGKPDTWKAPMVYDDRWNYDGGVSPYDREEC